MATKGTVCGVISNMVTLTVDGPVAQNEICYISTGGGAFLEFVEGKTLPAVAALIERAQ